MLALFYLTSLVAVTGTFLMITRRNPVHGVLYLIVSLLAVAAIFFLLGAAFAAALEVIIYAGAIMVLFLFVVMMLNLGDRAVQQENQWLRPGIWVGPGILSALLVAELAYVVAVAGEPAGNAAVVGPQEVGIALFGPYVLGVELASLLLMGGLVGAYHLGRRGRQPEEETEYDDDSEHARTPAGGGLVRTGARRAPRTT